MAAPPLAGDARGAVVVRGGQVPARARVGDACGAARAAGAGRATAALSRQAPAVSAPLSSRARRCRADRRRSVRRAGRRVNVDWPFILLVLWCAGLVCRRSHRSAPADADAARHPAFQLRRRSRRPRRPPRSPPPSAFAGRPGAICPSETATPLVDRRPPSAHPAARERRRAALGGRGADGAVPRAVARQACRSLAGAGAGGRRASLLLSSVRAAGVARVPAVPGSGL